MSREEDDQDGLLQCAVCFDVYDNPATLLCGHSFCLECINSVLRSNQRRCPICRATVPTGVSVAKNVVMAQMMENMVALSVKEVEIPEGELLFDRSVLDDAVTTQVFTAEWQGQVMCVKKLSGQDKKLNTFTLLSKLKHPNIVTLFGASSMPNAVAMVMEYLPGGSLYERLTELRRKDTALPLGEAIAYARQVCFGLHYLHARGIIHTNLAPEHIVLDAQGHLKLCGFGLNRHVPPKDALTVMHVLDPLYAAPEAVETGAYSAAMDVFALGMVLYELATGKVPWGRATRVYVALMMSSNERPPIPDTCHAGLRDIITLCWQADPHQRPTVTQILASLDSIAVSLSPDELAADTRTGAAFTTRPPTLSLPRASTQPPPTTLLTGPQHSPPSQLPGDDELEQLEAQFAMLGRQFNIDEFKRMPARQQLATIHRALLDMSNDDAVYTYCHTFNQLYQRHISLMESDAAFVHAGAVEAGLQRIPVAPERLLVVLMTFLKNMARPDANKSVFAAHSGISLPLFAMRAHPDHVKLQIASCDYLCNLAVDQGICNLITKEGGMRIIQGIMFRHLSHARVLESGCGVFWNLTKIDANAALFAKQDGARLIIAAMRAHPDDASVQEQACGAILNLAYNNDDNRNLIAGLGGIGLILDALRRHKSSLKCLEQCASAIRNLSCDNNANKLRVAREGGIETMLQVMKNNPHHPNLLQQSSGCLWNLASNNEVCQMIREKDGIPVVLQAMGDHPMHANLQEQCCGALRNITCNDKNREVVGRRNGILQLLRTLKMHISVPGVCEQSCGCLWNMAICNDNKKKIAENGGIDLVLRAMKEHLDDNNVQKEALGTLRNLCYRNSVNRDAIGEKGTGIVVSALRAHPEHRALVYAGAGCLRNLANASANRARLVAEGAIEVLVDARTKHAEHNGIMEAANAALVLLADSEENKRRIVRLGVPTSFFRQ